ncbi:hypothetical protein C491_09059 [Natronococcus amylolyticus DSM 10524]|uniref:Uncharacterized protein n=1 Tax=Natronococcus amylolyticus DSM 10524 TaxID=1227497 RepID=L9X8K1_9EURY|nr:hypothetical protein [Natronococcus amylolyticus]ELY57937.1 hypothetical protein C491_09059 [Natronococcus amylolyticus DSM 10524]
MADPAADLEFESLTPTHWAAIGLAAVTAAVHLLLGLSFLPHWMGGAFLVATAGFLLGIWLVLADRRRRLVYLVGIPFTGAQIVLWYVVNEPTGIADVTVAGAVDKVAQTLLIVALVVLLARGEREP